MSRAAKRLWWGSKSDLSYSILGILMREGKVKQLQNKKHIAAVK